MRFLLVCLQILSPLFWFFLMFGRVSQGEFDFAKVSAIVFECCLLVPIVVGMVGVSFWRDRHSWGRLMILASLFGRIALVLVAVPLAALLGGTNGGASLLGAAMPTLLFAVVGLIIVWRAPVVSPPSLPTA